MRVDLEVPYRLLAYEARFLKREINAKGGRVLSRDFSKICATNSGDSVRVGKLGVDAAIDLTYVHRILVGRRTVKLSRQALREGFRKSTQATRYGPHGLHEYKGKFNPQTPRSLILQHNWSLGEPILDPFAGSGTTLIEARHLGIASEGVELNPLAKVVAEAKLAWECAPKVVPPTLIEIRQARPWEFGEVELPYLKKWFPGKTLAGISEILGWAEGIHGADRLVAKVVLSNLLRNHSWQDPRDLRIRRRRKIPSNAPIQEDFVERMRKEWQKRLQWASGRHTHKRVRAKIFLGDATQLRDVRGPRRIAGTVSSPPYATALPYIDTHRLSIVTLGLAGPRDLGRLEASLAGARDITSVDEQFFERRLTLLSPECQTYLMRLKRVQEHNPDAGFRRKAIPFALARYLESIVRVMKELRNLEGNEAINLWVVGPNRTRVHGGFATIPTPNLVGSLAAANGFTGIKLEPLDAYGRFDIHSRNSIRIETLVSFHG
jgi:hypothetical protein